MEGMVNMFMLEGEGGASMKCLVIPLGSGQKEKGLTKVLVSPFHFIFT